MSDLSVPSGNFALSDGEVHVWKVRLESSNAALGGMPGLLSPEERERAGRFAFEKDQARFASCRASLRMLLGRYIGQAPESLRFDYEAHGKPVLAEIAGWQFNVSHSRDLAAIAISRGGMVGVDLEWVDAGFPREEVARDVLANDELRDLAAMRGDAQAAYFFQLWTMKEALLKAVGGGLSLEPRLIRIRLDGALKPEILSAPAEFNHASLHRLFLEEGYASALAVIGAVSDISIRAL